MNVTLCPPHGTFINGGRRQLEVIRIAQEQLEESKGGRGELTPSSCLLSASSSVWHTQCPLHTSCTHRETQTHTQTQNNNNFYKFENLLKGIGSLCGSCSIVCHLPPNHTVTICSFFRPFPTASLSPPTEPRLTALPGLLEPQRHSRDSYHLLKITKY